MKPFRISNQFTFSGVHMRHKHNMDVYVFAASHLSSCPTQEDDGSPDMHDRNEAGVDGLQVTATHDNDVILSSLKPCQCLPPP
jgi:hypothetical protein